MTKLGYQVEIAALHPAFNSIHEHVTFQENVKVTYVAQMHVRQEGNQRLYFNTPELLMVTATAAVALTKAALASKADVIHIAKAQPMNGLAGWLDERLHERPLYLDCDDDEAASNHFTSAWQRSVIRWWENRLPKMVKGVTVNTNYLRNRCIHLGIPADRIKLIPNGFDPERFRPPTPNEVERIRQRWGLANKKVVLYPGSLSFANHPIPLLLDAFELVHQQNSSTILLLVGGGEDYHSLVKEVETRELGNAVVIAGRVDSGAIPSIYAASHLVVDPVLDDDVARARCPLKIIEGFAMGIPAVTGNVGDRAEMLDNGQAGVLVRPGSVEALAEGIISALRDRECYNSMAERAKAVSEKFRWDRLVHEFIKIYLMG